MMVAPSEFPTLPKGLGFTVWALLNLIVSDEINLFGNYRSESTDYFRRMRSKVQNISRV